MAEDKPMAVYAVFDPLNPHGKYASIESLLADWDSQGHVENGAWYVYAFVDEAGSVFYIGKGTGTRAHDADGHRHGRLGYYVSEFWKDQYTVRILKSGLSNDDAELLEAMLFESFGDQLVNWAGNVGAMARTVTVAQARDTAKGFRTRARAAAAEGRLDEAESICREALSYLSKVESTEHEAELEQLRQLGRASLAARADLKKLESDNIPHAPVAACEVFSDLTKYLCEAGKAEEASREIEEFTKRYPRGSFCDYEFYDHRYSRIIRVAVTQREQATLRRVKRALERGQGKEGPTPPGE
jgi:hypothetical protein